MNGILFLIEHLNVLEDYFRFASVPGVIFVRISPIAEEEIISSIKPNVDLNDLLTSMPRIFNSGGLSVERKLCNSYTMGCPPVRGLSYVQVDKHGITILYHLHQCRLCTSRDISC